MANSIRELDKKIKKLGRNKKDEFLFCPVCGSTNIKQRVAGTDFFRVQTSNCLDCGAESVPLKASAEVIAGYRKKLAKKLGGKK